MKRRKYDVKPKNPTIRSEGQRRGRRPKVGLTEEVKVYLTPKEKMMLDQAAALDRKSMSEFLASAAIRSADYKLRRERAKSKAPQEGARLPKRKMRLGKKSPLQSPKSHNS